MKDLVVDFLSEQGAWFAVGAGASLGIWVFLKTKSFGKGLSVALGGFALAFFCLYPELCMAKGGEFLKWAVQRLHFR